MSIARGCGAILRASIRNVKGVIIENIMDGGFNMLKFSRALFISIADIDYEEECVYDDLSEIINKIDDAYTRGYLTRYLEELNESMAGDEIQTEFLRLIRRTLEKKGDSVNGC